MESKKMRSSNMELLRIFAMLMIIAYHIVLHAVRPELTDTALMERFNNGLFNNPVFYKKLLLLDFIMPLGITSNALFILISGYFMINRGKNIDLGKTAKKLLSHLAFAAVVLVIASNVYFRFSKGSPIIMLVINEFNTITWFVGYYFLVIIFAALFLNNYLIKADRNKYKIFLFTLFAVVQFAWSGSVIDNFAGGLRTLCIGVFLYALGGYIQIYNPFEKVRIPIIFAVIAGVYFLIFLSSYNNTQTNIQNYILSETENDFIQSVTEYYNHNAVPIVLAVSIFEIFRRIRIKNSKVINYFGGATFMIYLIHDNNFVRSVWKTQDWITLLYYSPIRFVIKIIYYTLIVFLIGVLAYITYNFTIKIYKHSKKLIFKEVRQCPTEQ